MKKGTDIMSYRKYADIIIDISQEKLDKTYQYAVPERLDDAAVIGAPVTVPFGKGNRVINGYIVDLTEEPKIDEELIKDIIDIRQDATVIESHLISLAYFIKENFGGTMNEALKTVIPVKKSVKAKESRVITLADDNEAERIISESKSRNNEARLRLLEALLKERELDYDYVIKELGVSRDVITRLAKRNVISLEATRLYRNPVEQELAEYTPVNLNEEQRHVVESITGEYKQGKRRVYLLHGITGSGKTEVYMEIISEIIKEGKQVIMLIPEIALTYQTVKRFTNRFGNRVSIINSRMSHGERYDQSIRAKNGDIDIIIGPRSALFTPFSRLGLIIIDEEHEGSYKSENTPKYHAVPVAVQRARLTGASVILGSATPSLESYKKASEGKYKLYTLTKRAKEAILPRIWIADMKQEFKNKNKSIFSDKLRGLIEDRLGRNEQVMLFINRRGYAGFISCRSCGYVIKCPHCDISLTSHRDGRNICHYCGYEENIPKQCPACGSRYIAAFGTGTQKVEDLVKKEFPGARVIRMDTDTTRKKGGHEKLLKAFAEHKADILVGTQMIVKGHDFPLVTLVGILAADMSLYAGDFRSAEKTFQLLSQAAGRAGRDVLTGEVVIQTYHPEHFSITCAAAGDYKGFYEHEIAYRNMMQYPPAAHILLILITSEDEARVKEAAMITGDELRAYNKDIMKNGQDMLQIIGPAPAQLSKANDIYRQVIYLKHPSYRKLVEIKNHIEAYYMQCERLAGCGMQFDFNPIGSY